MVSFLLACRPSEEDHSALSEATWGVRLYETRHACYRYPADTLLYDLKMLSMSYG